MSPGGINNFGESCCWDSNNMAELRFVVGQENNMAATSIVIVVSSQDTFFCSEKNYALVREEVKLWLAKKMAPCLQFMRMQV